jgi:hypothetical protein
MTWYQYDERRETCAFQNAGEQQCEIEARTATVTLDFTGKEYLLAGTLEARRRIDIGKR